MFLIRGVFLSFIFNVKISFLINFNNFLIKKCYILKFNKFMKKLIILTEALGIRDASLSFGKELLAVKLTFEQAMKFKGGFSSFKEMLKFYGEQNKLELGENYDGYLAIYYGEWGYQSVVLMRGAIYRLNERQYIVTYHYKEQNWPGVFKYIWTFNDCRFAENMRSIPEKEFETSPEEIEQSLKTKLVQGAINHTPVILTDEEWFALWSYGPDYYVKFFIEC